MAAKPETRENPPPKRQPDVPQPIEGGSDYLDSLGGWVDRLMGDKRHQRKARDGLSALVMSDDVGESDPQEAQVSPPEDPEPTVAPDPLEGGSEPATKGSDPSNTETRRAK